MIAAVTITTLKPQQYKYKALLTLKQKTYNTVDEAVSTIQTDCTSGMNLMAGYIYKLCNKSNVFYSSNDDWHAELFPKFMKGTVGGCSDATIEGMSFTSNQSFKLRNGACIYSKAGTTTLFVDVNGDEGPNGAPDRFIMLLSALDGIVTEMPSTVIYSYACNIDGCSQCSASTCTKCYCGYTLVNGQCKRTMPEIPGCTNYKHRTPDVGYDRNYYSDENCTIPIPEKWIYCTACATEVV